MGCGTVGTVFKIWKHIQNLMGGHFRSEIRHLSPRKGNLVHLENTKEKGDNDSLHSDDDQTNEPEPDIRQQIITVPQLWLWVVEGKSLTIYGMFHQQTQNLLSWGRYRGDRFPRKLACN